MLRGEKKGCRTPNGSLDQLVEGGYLLDNELFVGESNSPIAYSKLVPPESPKIIKIPSVGSKIFQKMKKSNVDSEK